MQSFRPAGNGAISGTAEGCTELRNSTMATATPLAAIMRQRALMAEIWGGAPM
jgi:hypothetical protein